MVVVVVGGMCAGEQLRLTFHIKVKSEGRQFASIGFLGFQGSQTTRVRWDGREARCASARQQGREGKAI